MGITKRKKTVEILIAVALLLLILIKPTISEASTDQAKGQIQIINQVRGEECCDKGNFDNLKTQVSASIINKVPATFSLRYDALKNPKYVNYLSEVSRQYPDLIKLGIFLEITPQLAKDSRVKYRGNATNWFSAENIYSVGYSDRENSEIGDNIFQTFRDEFEYYPDTVSSWMIKTNFLNYLKDKYNVKIAEITREQWDVDSYTLYGGPAHYPYPASRKWVLNPNYDLSNSALIVRQTLTDPLFIYGDRTSSYTSQPNDYLRNKKFDYFEKLLRQAVDQPFNTGFAVIGLENSMDKKYQREYVKQIQLIRKYKDQGLVALPDSDFLSKFWVKQKTNIYSGGDLTNNSNNQAVWITTPKYQIRLRREGNNIFIDDIRLFSSNSLDPYSNQVSYRGGIWINPFILDGSLNNKQENLSLFSTPKTDNKFTDVSNDVINPSAKIDLPNIKSGRNLELQNGRLGYANMNGERVSLNFSDDSIELKNVDLKQVKYTPSNVSHYPVKFQAAATGFDLGWSVANKKWINSIMKCQKKDCKLNFRMDESLTSRAFKDYYEFLFPQQSGHDSDNSQTVLYPNNQYAIANRNPVRLVLIPYDKYGIVTNLKNGCKDISVNYPNVVCSQDDKRFFLDLYSSTASGVNVKLGIIDQDVTKHSKVYFAPNCKREIKKCLTNPEQSWWYLNNIVGDKAREILNNEKQ